MKKKFGCSTLILILFLIFMFLGTIVNFIVNIEWFSEVKYLSVYFTKIVAIIKLMIPIFLTVFIVIWIYYLSLKKSIQKSNLITVSSKSNKVFAVINAIISLVVSIAVSTKYWYIILQFVNSVDFNIKDPIFNHDVSFYMFKLPLIQSVYSILMNLMIFLVVVTFIMYVILTAKDEFSFRRSFSSIRNFKSGITEFAGKQLAVVSCLILLLLSLGYLIKIWNLVYSPRSVVFGASYTDIKVSLLFYKIIAVFSLIASIVVLVSILSSKIKPIIVSIVTIILLVVVENIASITVQNFVVRSNEKTLEKKYISYNIDYTKKGFNIEDIEQQTYPLENKLTIKDIEDNKTTIDNIKVNSYAPALEYYNQLQVLKYYYKFNDIDIDRYNIDNKYTQVFIAPREIDVDALKENANTWQNRHLTYTHGYGVVMSKVNSVTSNGNPDFLIRDLPIKNTSGIKIDNPRIYYGEQTDDYAVVNTKIGELDYPEGSTNKMSNYDGTAGISMSLPNKILYSLYYKNFNFLLSRDITKDSKILINRNIKDRVSKVAPFLIYDNDPYIVINNGKLYWIIDAYTVSDRYPFSEPYNGINYIRNSVKVIVDAYNGEMNFYIVDKDDPIAQLYSKIFPKLFKKYEDVPDGMKEHFRYPEDLFTLQCYVLNKYHITDPSVFYSGDDLWEISKNEKQVDEGNQNSDGRNSSSYVIMKLPKEQHEEMNLIQYFNISKKNNMIAMLTARMDGDNYGKMNLYKFPAESVDSPFLFKQNIKQDPVISKEISFWNQEGSKVVFGDTVIIPIKQSLLYVEPVYIRANGTDSIPQMKKVILSYDNKLVMEDSVEKALYRIFGKEDNSDISSNNTEGEQSNNNIKINDEDIINQIKEANDIYNKAMQSLKDGDLAQYGEYINQLGDILKELQE